MSFAWLLIVLGFAVALLLSVTVGVALMFIGVLLLVVPEIRR